jgi:ankyrin repeat protein
MIGGQVPTTPLANATEVGNVAVARLLLDLGAPVDQGEGEDGDATALDRAALANQVEIARLLIERGADVNHVDDQGMTPLLYAASVDFGDSAMVDLLLKSGANPEMRTKDGLAALELARQRKSTHLLAVLRDRTNK